MAVQTRPNTRRRRGAARSAGRLRQRWRAVARHGDAGSSTVELAILAPLLVGLLLFVVLCGRLVTAQLDVDAAAHGAARAASIARSVPAATADAQRTALEILAARGVTCSQPDVQVSTGGLRPGGVVTVTVTCRVPLSDLALISVPGSRVVTATSNSPIDLWRGISSEFAISEASSPANRSVGGGI
jgi:Flp pilus assembly protein TadG